MPLDEIAAEAGKFIGRVFFEAVVHVLLEVVCFFLGFATLRALTLGQYPPSDPTEKQVIICQSIGVVELLAPIAWFAVTRLCA